MIMLNWNLWNIAPAHAHACIETFGIEFLKSNFAGECFLAGFVHAMPSISLAYVVMKEKMKYYNMKSSNFS